MIIMIFVIYLDLSKTLWLIIKILLIIWKSAVQTLCDYVREIRNVLLYAHTNGIGYNFAIGW